MKIGVILGRGVEGVGVTKNVVEFQKLFPAAHYQSFPDKNGHFLTPDFPELQADIANHLLAK